MDTIISLAKYYLKSIPTKKELTDFIDELNLSVNEEVVLREVYLNGKTLDFIADSVLGYSIQNVKVIHRKALLKVGSYIQSNIK
jgi:hypothetical protein